MTTQCEFIAPNRPGPDFPVGAPPAAVQMFSIGIFFFLSEWKSNEEWRSNWPNYGNQTELEGVVVHQHTDR